jgi:protein-arginine kinase activator protein McsA
MLCEQCHQQEATVHLMQIVGGVVEKVVKGNLCVECFKAFNPIEAPPLTEVSHGLCQYCGAQPCSGGTDFLALTTGVRKMKFMCIACSLEHARYIRRELGRISPDLSQEEELTALRLLSVATDKHMKLWASVGGFTSRPRTIRDDHSTFH